MRHGAGEPRGRRELEAGADGHQVLGEREVDDGREEKRNAEAGQVAGYVDAITRMRSRLARRVGGVGDEGDGGEMGAT